jgi:hypothetical protein
MKQYNIRSLITRGSNHPLRCEDDFFICERESTITAAVFDGCSSGIDSHVASSLHKRIMNDVGYINPNISPKETAKDILGYIYEKLIEYQATTEFKINEEMLSTIVLLLVNKYDGRYCVVVAGDGVININDAYFNIHDKEGESVFYLSSTIRTGGSAASNDERFEEYFAKHCTIFEGDDFRNIAISTDGIDTFKSKFGVALKEKPRDYFMRNQAFEKTENQLKRLYNIFTQGLNLEDKVPCMNFDDFTMIKIHQCF